MGQVLHKRATTTDIRNQRSKATHQLVWILWNRRPGVSGMSVRTRRNPHTIRVDSSQR